MDYFILQKTFNFLRSHLSFVDLISCTAGVSPIQNVFTLCWNVWDPLVTEFSFWVRYSDLVLFYYVAISTFSSIFFKMLSSEYILHLLKKQVAGVLWIYVWVLIYHIELCVCFTSVLRCFWCYRSMLYLEMRYFYASHTILSVQNCSWLSLFFFFFMLPYIFFLLLKNGSGILLRFL